VEQGKQRNVNQTDTEMKLGERSEGLLEDSQVEQKVAGTDLVRDPVQKKERVHTGASGWQTRYTTPG
jgi:hypothetical protein